MNYLPHYRTIVIPSSVGILQDSKTPAKAVDESSLVTGIVLQQDVPQTVFLTSIVPVTDIFRAVSVHVSSEFRDFN